MKKPKNMKRGGKVHGRGTSRSDSVPIKVEPGQAILPKKTMDAIEASLGKEGLRAMMGRTRGGPPRHGMTVHASAGEGVMSRIAAAQADKSIPGGIRTLIQRTAGRVPKGELQPGGRYADGMTPSYYERLKNTGQRAVNWAKTVGAKPINPVPAAGGVELPANTMRSDGPQIKKGYGVKPDARITLPDDKFNSKPGAGLKPASYGSAYIRGVGPIAALDAANTALRERTVEQQNMGVGTSAGGLAEFANNMTLGQGRKLAHGMVAGAASLANSDVDWKNRGLWGVFDKIGKAGRAGWDAVADVYEAEKAAAEGRSYAGLAGGSSALPTSTKAAAPGAKRSPVTVDGSVLGYEYGGPSGAQAPERVAYDRRGVVDPMTGKAVPYGSTSPSGITRETIPGAPPAQAGAVAHNPLRPFGERVSAGELAATPRQFRAQGQHADPGTLVIGDRKYTIGKTSFDPTPEQQAAAHERAANDRAELAAIETGRNRDALRAKIMSPNINPRHKAIYADMLNNELTTEATNARAAGANELGLRRLLFDMSKERFDQGDKNRKFAFDVDDKTMQRLISLDSNDTARLNAANSAYKTNHELIEKRVMGLAGFGPDGKPTREDAVPRYLEMREYLHNTYGKDLGDFSTEEINKAFASGGFKQFQANNRRASSTIRNIAAKFGLVDQNSPTQSGMDTQAIGIEPSIVGARTIQTAAGPVSAADVTGEGTFRNPDMTADRSLRAQIEAARKAREARGY